MFFGIFWKSGEIFFFFFNYASTNERNFDIIDEKFQFLKINILKNMLS